MNTEEKLKRIRAKCEELLAIAEKRTPGKWLDGWELNGVTCGWQQSIKDGHPVVSKSIGFSEGGLVSLAPEKYDATFIASCAGNAEAGWRATIAAIDQGSWLMEMACQGRISLQDHGAIYCMIQEIIAAWPEELL